MTVSHHHYYYYYRPPTKQRGILCRVCPSVCQTITFESFIVGSSYSHIRYISRECRSRLVV